MTPNLTKLERRRMQNLKLLHGKPKSFGSPTSKLLAGQLTTVPISAPELSNIFGEKKVIDDYLASQIENALGVGQGWLSREHELWLKANTDDHNLVVMVLTLRPEAKSHLTGLLRSIETSVRANAKNNSSA